MIASDAEHAEHATTEPLNSTEPGVNENLMSIQGEVCDNMGEGSFRSDEKTQTVTDPEISGFEDASVLHEVRSTVSSITVLHFRLMISLSCIVSFIILFPRNLHIMMTDKTMTKRKKWYRGLKNNPTIQKI